MTNKTLDITEIQKILPHRYPMLLIDQVDELIPGKKAVAVPTRGAVIFCEGKVGCSFAFFLTEVVCLN